MTWQFAVAGLAIGLLVGMTGMGGGSLMTPMLILLFGFDAKTAVGTDILHGAAFKSVGAARHRQLGTVHWRLAAWMLIGSAPLSLLGVQIASSFGSGAEDQLARIVGAAVIAGGLMTAAKAFIHKPVPENGFFALSRRDKIVAISIGAGGGFLVGLTSVGSGLFFGLVMLLVYPLTAQKIVGTDMAHAAALLWVAGASHLIHGNVDVHAMAWLLVGSIPGVLVGSSMSVRVPERALRFGFAVVLLLSGVKVAKLPHADQIVIAGAAATALAVAFVLVRKLWLRPAPHPLQER
jgi:uncharacterized membrane protein YfcA